MKEIAKDYKKYRWFFTSSGKLVMGGKNAEQNDELLKRVKKSKEEYYVMHTSHPGSPFSVIIGKLEKISKNDLDECAIFTGCFSRAWKDGKKKTKVHIFNSEQLYKDKNMKEGTWGVRGKVKEKEVELNLVLTKQDNVYRAVPEKTVPKKDMLLKISPGSVDKAKILEKLRIEIDDDFPEEQMLSALPSGGIRIVR